jgi:DNA-binding transcriptional regulator YiaG
MWLAFGDRYRRSEFVAVPELFTESGVFEWHRHLRWQDDETPFLAILIRNGAAAAYESHLKTGRPEEEIIGQTEVAVIKKLYEEEVKRYLASKMVTPTSWKELRLRLKAATDASGEQAALARAFGVSTAAVSQWLSGATAPKADTALRLLKWVTAAEAKQKSAPEVRKHNRRKPTRKEKLK